MIYGPEVHLLERMRWIEFDPDWCELRDALAKSARIIVCEDWYWILAGHRAVSTGSLPSWFDRTRITHGLCRYGPVPYLRRIEYSATPPSCTLIV